MGLIAIDEVHGHAVGFRCHVAARRALPSATRPTNTCHALPQSESAGESFAWAFLGRFLMILGYYSVASYQLSIPEDYIGLSHDLLPLLSVAMLPGMILMIVVMGPRRPS